MFVQSFCGTTSHLYGFVCIHKEGLGVSRHCFERSSHFLVLEPHVMAYMLCYLIVTTQTYFGKSMHASTWSIYLHIS
jgi:hypothetical protein